MLDEIGISEEDFNQLTFDALVKVEPRRKNISYILSSNTNLP